MTKSVIDYELTIEFFPLGKAISDLESEWRSLELKTDASFFLTWAWLGSWLDIARNHCRINILKVLLGDEIVGLALLVEESVTRRKIITSVMMIFNSSRIPEFNMIIEHNGLLIKAGYEERVTSAVLDYLDKKFPEIDEFVIPFSDADTVIKTLLQGRKLYFRTLEILESPYVDLDLIRQEKTGFLESLSSNTRYQIRKSLKRYSELGEPGIEQAVDVESAIVFFEKLKKLHQESWRQRGLGGSFSNPTWESFHRDIIRKQFDNHNVQLLRVYAGNNDIGYIYSLVLNGRVNMIQTGFDYSLCHNAKPGYVCHYLAVEHNLLKGMKIYDFLAGDSQYKRSLSNKMNHQEILVLQRRKMKFLFEDMAVRLHQQKNKIFNQ